MTTVTERGRLTDLEIRKIQKFIGVHYKEMYLLWCSYDGGEFYRNV